MISAKSKMTSKRNSQQITMSPSSYFAANKILYIYLALNKNTVPLLRIGIDDLIQFSHLD